jgi:hypothetical protein
MVCHEMEELQSDLANKSRLPPWMKDHICARGSRNTDGPELRPVSYAGSFTGAITLLKTRMISLPG